jgi:hypothetical protein
LAPPLRSRRPLGPGRSQLKARIDEIWAAGQQELADESTAGSLKSVSGAGHEIQVDQPGAVIDALERILDDLATS